MREEIEKQGGLKLIYIDPPFGVGADFSMDIEIGPSTGSVQAHTFTKKPNILEEIAYRDTWGNGADSFINIKWLEIQNFAELNLDEKKGTKPCDWFTIDYINVMSSERF